MTTIWLTTKKSALLYCLTSHNIAGFSKTQNSSTSNAFELQGLNALNERESRMRTPHKIENHVGFPMKTFINLSANLDIL
jgi:hypothetical protein